MNNSTLGIFTFFSYKIVNFNILFKHLYWIFNADLWNFNLLLDDSIIEYENNNGDEYEYIVVEDTLGSLENGILDHDSADVKVIHSVLFCPFNQKSRFLFRVMWKYWEDMLHSSFILGVREIFIQLY